MTEIDDAGMFELLGGVVKRAQQDARRGKPEVAADAAEFLTDLAGDDVISRMPEWFQTAWAEQKQRAAAQNAQEAPKPAPVALSADEIADRARRLTDLGISPQWAAIQADPVKMAAAERQQKRRDLAARLNVDPRYLPEDFGND